MKPRRNQIARADAEAAREYFAAEPRPSILGEGQPATTFIWGGGELVDGWPAAPDESEYSRMRGSDVETLVIGGELDMTTPPQIATRELMPYLPKGRQVVLEGFGHSFDFWTFQPEAGTRLVTAFLESGRVDQSGYEPQRVDFTPEVTQPALAKGIGGAMIGLVLLTIVSLLLLARRVWKRGRLGRKASAVLRSVYPVALGLGGWFLGLLVVFTAVPGVPIDDELLGALSMGVPIGLGIYLAWMNRDWSGSTKAIGFAAAAGGALLGAWLGFNVIEGLPAVLTTIAGAIAGANLLLLGLDIAWDREARDRFAVTSNEPLAASPTAG